MADFNRLRLTTCLPILFRKPHSETRPAPGDSDDQLDRPQSSALDCDESKPLITFVLPSLGLGGAEIVGATLASEFLKRGFRTEFVVAMHEKGAFTFLPPLAGYVPLEVKPLSVLLPLVRYLRQRRPSAVIVSQWPLTVMAIVARKLAGSRARLAVCSHNAQSIQCGSLASPKRLLFKKSMSLTYPFADARIAVSAGVADDLAKLCGLRREEMNVVYNPLLERPTDWADVAAAEAIWGGWPGPRILTVGSSRPQKNHALLMRAFKKLLVSRDARLLILGGGEGLETTRAYARSLNVADKVIIPGGVSNPTAYYRSASVFALSSDTEGFGNVIIEALACGLPVVSTDCPYGPTEILAGGRYGRLTPVGNEDALARAILERLDSPNDPDAAKRRAAEYAVEDVAERYLRLLFPQ